MGAYFYPKRVMVTFAFAANVVAVTYTCPKILKLSPMPKWTICVIADVAVPPAALFTHIGRMYGLRVVFR